MPRLIPLRVKEQINRAAGRAIFDLSYYLQFQPSSLEHTGVKLALRPQPAAPATRTRVALVTPHLGPGGAEKVLLDIAQSFDRNVFELFLIATHSRDSRWRDRWNRHVDHVHDLAAGYRSEEIASALYSLVVNHEMHGLVLQNTLYGYVVLPRLRQTAPMLRIVDLIHAVGGGWDLVSVTASAARVIDTRIVISEAARRHLAGLGVNPDRIRLIPNGVDLSRFHPSPPAADGIFRILFAARLDPVKRSLLLPPIAAELRRLQPERTFRFIVAGDGPQSAKLRAQVQRDGLQPWFDFRGFVDDTAPLLAESDVLLLTSSHEGIPLTILEAFASGRPAVAPSRGAIAEVLDPATGMLVSAGDNPAAFANALSMLMRDPGLRQRMGVAARQKAERHYDYRKSMEAYRQLWRDVFQSGR
jgi:glycosyltransferase involved in cell wall biosynthesis